MVTCPSAKTNARVAGGLRMVGRQRGVLSTGNETRLTDYGLWFPARQGRKPDSYAPDPFGLLLYEVGMTDHIQPDA
jgi:hypothetical protein